MKTAIVAILVLLFNSWSLNAQISKQVLPQSLPVNTTVKGQTIKLSAGTIFIVVRDAEPHFVIENVNKSLDAKNLSQFLNAFYENSKVKRQNDIVVRSKTKRLVAGQDVVDNLLDELRRRHRINVVYLPPVSGANADAAIEEFARKFLR